MMQKMEKCPECGGRLISKDEIFCLNCGLVMPYQPISYSIPRSIQFAAQRPCQKSSIISQQLKRALKRENRIKVESEKFRLHALSLIEGYCKRLGIDSQDFVRNVLFLVLDYKKKIDPQRVNLNKIVPGAIYYLAKEKKMPLSVYKISKRLGISRKSLHKAYKIFGEEYGFPELIHPEYYAVHALSFLFDYYQIKGEQRREIIEGALSLIRRLREEGKTMGRDPKVVAAYAISEAISKEELRIHKKEIAEVLNVTLATLRNYKRALSQSNF